MGAVPAWIGLIHASEVGWAAAPQVSLGYLFFGAVCAACSFLPGTAPPPETDMPEPADTIEAQST
ncbi:hypothetical protein [Nocardia acidivorans]|uniref:hypothetical protein n=1 Tax=Nocardia acidivorans TaxID=404580 RepID=UPI0008309739|nr:hypothetical protein [Nocardia acidivorans]